jgi:hypothetical protein
MYTIYIRVRCPQRCAEMLPDNLEQAEVVVEAQVSQALLELFGAVIVEDVSMTYIPTEQEQA